MKPGKMSAAEARLRVYGSDGLRVADGSIMRASLPLARISPGNELSACGTRGKILHCDEELLRTLIFIVGGRFGCKECKIARLSLLEAKLRCFWRKIGCEAA